MPSVAAIAWWRSSSTWLIEPAAVRCPASAIAGDSWWTSRARTWLVADACAGSITSPCEPPALLAAPVGSRQDDPRHRPGDDRNHVLGVRRAGRAGGPRLQRVHPALSQARLGRARCE